ncbi:hypothetical protein LJC59_09725 [Desulfovibrio sp. OttesenSCG-928-A18]|nr:hypothetical protein [Desulfovibrio sp. OttesenSCG-928-A18]
MATKTKIFLSSPMPRGNALWEVIRDSITTLFEHGPLSTFFELIKIDTEGGEAPDAIYVEQVSESQIVLTVFDDEIRQGQRDEINKAIE